MAHAFPPRALALSAPLLTFLLWLGLLGVVALPATAQQRDVLFVAASNPPGASDAAVIAELEAQGFSVTPVDDNVVVTANAQGRDLVVISSTVSSGRIGTKFTHAAVPVLCMEAWTFDDLGMTGTATSAYGSLPAEQEVDVHPGHPLAAGYTGITPVYVADERLYWGVPGANAAVAASVVGDPARAAIFGYETGSAMVSGNAPARRVGFFLGDDAPGVWTNAAVDLLLAAAEWASGPAINQPPVVAAGPDRTASVGTITPLDGSVVDDGLSGPLTVFWSVLSGPGNAVIADPGSAATAVSFDAPGLYELELTADDAEFVATDRVLFDVQAAAPGGDALFVASSAVPNPVDAAIVSRLEGWGFDVVVVDDNVVTSGDALGMDLILVSESVNSGSLSSKFTATAVPLIVWESWIFDDLGMTGPSAATHYGSQPNQTQLAITGGHPLAAGLSGTVTMTTAPDRFYWGAPAPGAVVAATLVGQPSGRAAVFGYEAGSPMAVGSAPARRVGFFLGPGSASAWTPDLEALLQAAVQWAASSENLPPVVSAGADADAFVGVEAPLSGSVDDDGVAGPLVIAWTPISGPGNVSIADPSSASTSVSFDAPGLYQLELSADDSEFTVTDVVRFDVSAPPPNQPPVVAAGADGNGVAGAAVQLQGSVEDDGVSGSLEVLWSALSGPGTASFSNPASPTSQVVFSAPGQYDLELSADDGEFTVSDVVRFSVAGAGPIIELLYVASNNPPNGADQAIVTQLELWGYDVTVVDDNAVTTAHANGMDLVVVSSSVGSAQVANKFTSSTVPLISSEAWIFDDLGMTASSAAAFGSVEAQTQLAVLGGHPLSAGLSGLTPIAGVGTRVYWGVPAPNAIVAARVAGDPGRATVFAYEAGSAMASGVAPARRVGFFLEGRPTTANTWQLLEAAVRWATGAPPVTRLRIYPLGDSITRGTAGTWSYRNALWTTLDGERCHVDFMGTLNGPSSGTTGPGRFDRDHDGHAGFRTDEVAAGVAGWLVGNRPDVVLLHLGTNDVRQGTSLAAAKERLRDILDAVRAAHPQVRVLLAQIIPSSAQYESRVQTLNGLIADLAAEEDTAQSPISLVDMYTGYDNATLNFDNIHPSDEGDAWLAIRWRDALDAELSGFCD